MSYRESRAIEACLMIESDPRLRAALRTICRDGLRPPALAQSSRPPTGGPMSEVRKKRTGGDFGMPGDHARFLPGGVAMPNDVVRLPVRERTLHADPARSYTLPARYYTSPEIYKQEAEAIFFRTWQYAGHASDLPAIGSYITCQILDQNIIIVRGKDEKLRAFYNVCSHRA